MAWKVDSVEVQRASLCHRILTDGLSVSQAAREAGVSRKTIYKFLSRRRADATGSLSDRSRRPQRSPLRSESSLEEAVLSLRDRYHWGARKIHTLLSQQMTPQSESSPQLCSIRTITAILNRHGRIDRNVSPKIDESIQCSFERPGANDLWQADHKGPVEIGRVKHHPWMMIDDHSRFCLCFEPLTEKSLAFTWPILWECFGIYGLPEAILSDGAFADRGTGISEWDQRLIRLGIQPIHGRAYHPQTQGKVERLNRTIDWELLEFNARTESMDLFLSDRDRWKETYNFVRPHEALNDQPPISRYLPSRRKRPGTIPPIGYESGSLLRRVSQVGDISYHRKRIAVGRALARQEVKLKEETRTLEIYFGPALVRVIELDLLASKGHNQIV